MDEFSSNIDYILREIYIVILTNKSQLIAFSKSY